MAQRLIVQVPLSLQELNGLERSAWPDPAPRCLAGSLLPPYSEEAVHAEDKWHEGQAINFFSWRL